MELSETASALHRHEAVNGLSEHGGAAIGREKHAIEERTTDKDRHGRGRLTNEFTGVAGTC
jgi:hypothetical protein